MTPSDREFLEQYDADLYHHPSVTVDILIFSAEINGPLELLLIRRSIPPFKDYLAIPGGFVQMEESLSEAARRKLLEETGVSGVPLEQLYTFGDVNRDPRTRVISVAYFCLLPKSAIRVSVGEGASSAGWYPVFLDPNDGEDGVKVGDGEELAFDHKHIIRTAVERLRGKLTYTDIAFHMLGDPNRFAIYELQKIYETILDERLNTPNFRRMFLNTYVAKGLAEPTGEACSEYSKRASQYYRKT